MLYEVSCLLSRPSMCSSRLANALKLGSAVAIALPVFAVIFFDGITSSWVRECGVVLCAEAWL